MDRLVSTGNVPGFRAAIAQSGISSVSAYPNYYTTSWPSLVSLTGCDNATSQIKCVRAVPATTVKQIIQDNFLIFAPENDNITQFATPNLNRRTQQQAAKIPYLVGNNGGEGYPFMIGFNDVDSAIQYDFLNPSDAQVAAIKAAYPVTNGLTTFDVIAQIFTDAYFQCPNGYTARASADAGYPIWRYFFNQSYPNLQLLPGYDLHSYHTIEASLVFGTYPRAGATTGEINISKFFQMTWANFAKNPMAGPGWTQVLPGGSETSTNKDIGHIGKNDVPGITLITEKKLDYRCGLYQPQYTTVNYPPY